MGSFCSKFKPKSDQPAQTINVETSDSKIDDMSTATSKKRKLEEDIDDNKSEPAKKKQKVNTNENEQKQVTSMTRQEFFRYAKEVIGVCGDIKFVVKPKRNSTDSVGWHASQHVIINMDKNKNVAVIISLNATVIGSKQWEDGEDQNKNKNKNKEENEDEDIKQDKNIKTVNKKGDIMTKTEFMDIAKELILELFEEKIVLKPKKSKQGSVGWGASGLKIKREVNGVMLKLQTSVNFTVKKSKDWEDGSDKKNE